ncbi:hypothetical protein IG195_13960 [Arthrobacter sp. TES]|uniref:ATP-binding protein n=1 Tax=Paenarthrobacter ureafaciens TaxID=37931 RepID=UPI00111AB68A|nr:ATP-binding protein [Paenarthrobacter ureafaciens]QOI62652.1 hypothetical protein IG195_13960 [Arthrobacter sp. TES]GLU58825.1 hypothetical protein Pure01_13380 [Paenarthrobacter ureafaciens]GLU62072.1 hypothetical protein Pure02_03220 [Paenarthrobacter ureafaciens]GLU66346.1 hypothetical protein Pure03_03220 [Paenarthrobacter ureafaciens]GLU71330.1 hypothetical protein Pure04_10450 [Paenarthrobacter ureafaciens]
MNPSPSADGGERDLGVADLEMILEEIEAANASGEPSKPTSSRLRIDAVRIRNFKKIEDTRIELGPITYLVGGNNSG